MYPSSFFSEKRPEVLHSLIAQYPLGMLVSAQQQLDVLHLPFEFQPREGDMGSLYAHIARANPLWKTLAADSDVLVVFRGAEAYISPNWYPSKQETHREVPTWNYQAVHVRGRISFREDEDFLRQMIASLTRKQESAMPHPWQLSDAPENFLSAMLKAVVGIEIRISEIDGLMKLGQNKKAADLEGAVTALYDRGQREIADAMRAAGREKR